MRRYGDGSFDPHGSFDPCFPYLLHTDDVIVGESWVSRVESAFSTVPVIKTI